MKISEMTNESLVANAMPSAISYTAYRELVATHAQHETSTGNSQTEALSEYTQLNNARMRRLDKTLKVPDQIASAFKNTRRKQQWIVITESWCGDAAQSMPAMKKLADLADNIDLHVVLRDEHPALMDAFLTNGSRSIPKLLVFDVEKKAVVDSWGPRPSIAAQMVVNYKTLHGALTPQFKRDLQIWYTKDKGQNIFHDLAQLID